MSESTSDNERSESAALVERYSDEIARAFAAFDTEQRRRRARAIAAFAGARRREQREDES